MTPVLRLGALVTLAVLLQAGVFPAIRLFGVVPDVGLVLALAVAYRFGAATGASVGFAAGLGYDLFLETPLGLSALAYALTAYAVGVLQTGLIRSPRWVAPAIGGLGGFAGGLVFVVLGIIFGVDTLRDWSVVGLVARVAVYDAIVALVVFPLVRRFVPDPDTARQPAW